MFQFGSGWLEMPFKALEVLKDFFQGGHPEPEVLQGISLSRDFSFRSIWVIAIEMKRKAGEETKG